MGTPSPGTSHDIVLLNANGSIYGYRSTPNTSHRGVVDAFRKAIGGSDNPRYQDMSTVKIHAQTDWHSGHGNIMGEDGYVYYNKCTNIRKNNIISRGSRFYFDAARTRAYGSMGTNTIDLMTFANPSGSTQLLRTTASGAVYAKLHGTESWNTPFALGYNPTSITVFPAGSPSSDFIMYGRPAQTPYYTRYPGTGSFSQVAGEAIFDVTCLHRGLLYSGTNITGYQGIYVNSLASPFWNRFVKAIGNNTSKFTNLYSCGNALIIGKTDGLWCIPDTDATSIVPYRLIDFSSRPSTENFKYMTENEGKLITSSDDGELWEIDGSFDPTYNRTIRAVGPFHKKTVPRFMRGNISGLMRSTMYPISSVDAGSIGMSGLYLNNGAGWSNLVGLGSICQLSAGSGLISSNYKERVNSISGIIGSPLFNPSRIYIGVNNDIGYIEFNDREESALNVDSTNYFQDESEAIVVFDAGLASVTKWFDKVTVFGSAEMYPMDVKVYYSLDPQDLDNIKWTSMGYATTPSSADLRFDNDPVSFPAGSTAKRIALKFTIYTTDSIKNASIEAITIHYLPRPGQNKAYRYSFDVWRPSDQNLLSGVELTTMQDRADNLFDIHASQVPVTMYRSTGAASPNNVTGHRVIISDIDESESIPNTRTNNTHPRGLKTNVTFIEV